MYPELTLDRVQVEHRLSQPRAQRGTRRIERHLGKVARRIDRAEKDRRRLARERDLEQTAQLLLLANWRQA